MLLNPTMPSEVSVGNIPMQQLPSFFGLFRLRQFNGIALVQKLHLFGQLANAFVHLVLFIGAFVAGSVAEVIISLIVIPISFLFYAAGIRVLGEAAISLLIIPPLLMKQRPGGGQPVDDLAAFGVPEGAIAAETIQSAV